MEGMSTTSDPSEAVPARPARFIVIPHFIYEMLTKHELLVYVALAYHANEDGYSWPSHATIAQESGLSVSAVRRALDALMERDGFRREVRTRPGMGQTSNGYYVPIHGTPRPL